MTLELLDELCEILMELRLVELADDEDCDDRVLLDSVLLESVELLLLVLDELGLDRLVELLLELVAGLDELELLVLDDDEELLLLEESEVLLLECPVELEFDELELDELCPLLRLVELLDDGDELEGELLEFVELELANNELDELDEELDFDDEELNSDLELEELLDDLVEELELFPNWELLDESVLDELVAGLDDEDDDLELLSDELEEEL